MEHVDSIVPLAENGHLVFAGRAGKPSASTPNSVHSSFAGQFGCPETIRQFAKSRSFLRSKIHASDGHIGLFLS